VRLIVNGVGYRGRAVTVASTADPTLVARAVREGEATEDGQTVLVQSQRPHQVHERVGCLHTEMGLRTRTALAEAGRARGLSTPHDDALEAAREELRGLAPETVDTTPQRRAVATASAETDRLRERVAETRGRLAERRDANRETDEVTADLEAAARDLSEAETSAVAARQNLSRQREEARTARNTLDRRLALEDEVANLRRQARRALVERLRDAYAAAVDAVPGGSGGVPDPFEAEPVTAGLAVARVADFDGPVVLACDRFADADAAAAWLGAPVIRLV
jgi:hypothetical protein